VRRTGPAFFPEYLLPRISISISFFRGRGSSVATVLGEIGAYPADSDDRTIFFFCPISLSPPPPMFSPFPCHESPSPAVPEKHWNRGHLLVLALFFFFECMFLNLLLSSRFWYLKNVAISCHRVHNWSGDFVSASFAFLRFSFFPHPLFFFSSLFLQYSERKTRGRGDQDSRYQNSFVVPFQDSPPFPFFSNLVLNSCPQP